MKRLVVLAVCLSFCAAARADFCTGFEAPTYSGSPGGTLLTGQDGWYNPVAGSADYKVYTYAGNTYGIVQNPYGAAQFVGGRHEGLAAFARAQHDYAWSSEDVWRVTYDVCTTYTAFPPAVDNIGSFSLQPSTTAAYLQSLYVWMDPNTPTLWQSGYLTNENPVAPPVIPGAAWQNLSINHWYRESTLFRLSDHLILEVSIEDLTTGDVTVVSDPGWHLINPSNPLPTAFRFFTGGGAGSSPAGNFVAWDNLHINPPRVLGDLNCDTFVNFGDINPFVLALTDPAGYATVFPDCDIMNGDINEDCGVNFGDINPFVALLTGL
jgi:hypothetical protein